MLFPRNSLKKALLSSGLVLLLSGCAGLPAEFTTPQPSTAGHGRVMGGRQPITGGNVSLYAVNTTTTGGASSLLYSTTTDANGGFTLTSHYTCPTPTSTPVYVLVTGGNPGLSANNPNLALMAAVGACSGLSTFTFISVDELTTVGAIYALSPYMTSGTAIGSASATNLAAAFTLASEYVNTGSGSAPGLNVPSGMIPPTAQIYTIGDAIYSCVNSGGGVTGDGSSCGNLFAATTPSGGPAPTDTVTAVLDMALNPTTISPSAIFALVTAQAPYQPAFTVAPADWTATLVAATAGPVLATGDSRFVSQPTYPAVCLTVTAQAYGSGVTRSAPPSSSADDTTAIQNALSNAACKNTGKAVELAANGANAAFYSESLTITGETLIVDSGVTLYGNTYNTSSSPFLTITGTNAGLMGPGTVDGRGDLLTNTKNNRLVQTSSANNLIVYNVTLTQSIYPNLYIQGGNGATVWGVTILTPGDRANADGIDVDSISNVTVTNSSIEDGDDGIAVKSNNSSTYNVTVSNNKLYATHGLSIGSIASNTVSNVLFVNNYVYGIGKTFPANITGLANDINIKVDPCTLTVQQVSYVNTCVKQTKHLLELSTNYSTCGGGGSPVLSGIVVNGLLTNSSQSSSYEIFQGYSAAAPIIAYIANVSLDVAQNVSSSYPVQYGTYYLSNTGSLNPATLSGATGVTSSSFTPVNLGATAVPACSF